VPAFEEINVDYDPGTTVEVTMHDGSSLRLKKLEQEYDPTDKVEAVSRLMKSHAKGEVLTGVFYINAKAPNFIDMLNVTDKPLATLPESLTRPSREALAQCMAELQ
jgi:2-oxoglutarate/2-oxoacid ferredoxin oxidoreductase subunit beta